MTRIIDQPRYVCALGAMQTVQGIYRGVPVLHAGPGCAAKLAGGIAGIVCFLGAWMLSGKE